MNIPRWAFWLLVAFLVGQVLHWYQLMLVARKAGATIQIPKMKSAG